METKNKNNTLLIIIIILLIVVSGQVGYLISESNHKNEQANSDLQEEKKEEKTKFEKMIEIKQKSLPITISNINEKDSILMELIIDKIEIKENGDAYLTINKIIPNQYPTYYKVMTDVVDVVVHTYGQGGFRTIIFLKSNGTVSVIAGTDLVNNGVINIKNNVGGFTNIVDIETYKAIDVDGIEHALTTSFYN